MVEFVLPTDVGDALSKLADGLGEDDTKNITSMQVGIIRCRKAQNLTNMAFGVPAVVFPVSGGKTIYVEERSFSCRRGEMLIIPDGVCFRVENMPDELSGRYLGMALRFDVKTLSLFKTLYGNRFSQWDLTSKWKVPSGADILTMITDWVSWVKKFPPEPIHARHRMAELLFLFAQNGYAGNLLLQKHESWDHRLRNLLILDPARNWMISEACMHLHVSESALRRHLKTEQAGFRGSLEEVRLEHGMGLVLETDLPIGRVSLDSGYQSQSRFSERFKKRYGMTPRELRNTRFVKS